MQIDSDIEKALRSAKRIYVHGVPSTPRYLLERLSDVCSDSQERRVYHIEISDSTEYFNSLSNKKIRDISLFIGQNMRSLYRSGLTEYFPAFLSDIPWMIKNVIKPDVALIGVSPPDRHSNFSLGANVVEMNAAIESAKVVIGEVNTQIPFTLGDSVLNVRKPDLILERDQPMQEYPPLKQNHQELEVGQMVSDLVDNGATVQAGIGKISDSAMLSLEGHQNLGIHTELFSNGMFSLVEKGVVNNRYKSVDRGYSVATFAKGSKSLYSFIENNSSITFKSVDYTNDTSIIRRNHLMTSINTCLSMDITGQIDAESIGMGMISGVGGQMDFVRGAALSPGGKSIFAFTSKTDRGISRIVPSLLPGSAVTTTRNHVQYVVTENGVINLHGLSMVERARSIISIADPDERDNLEKYARSVFPNF